MIDTEKKQEKVILVAAYLGEADEAERSLDELEELVETAGAVAVGRLTQARDSFHPGTYIGKGKIEELKELIYDTEAVGIVCDDELSPAQIRNLREELDTKVMDRTLVILDIFASRASSAEGKVQVELAQQRYMLSHLAGFGTSLSRLGGGIGTRGPGEKKIEMDRRYIRDRISQLKKELEEIARHREVTRAQRQSSHTKVAAIVGYTNAGKSTLLNTVTQAGVLEEDKLFATLDPTTRPLKLESGQEILLTDTVGFIRKLPHHLIEAFKSTLEEAKYADYIIHVVDASNPQMDEHIAVVYETLNKLGASGKKIITLFNKMDKVEGEKNFRDFTADYNLYTAIKKGAGIDELKNTLEEILREDKILIEKVFPYNEAGKIQQIRKYGELLEEEYVAEGIRVKAYVPGEIYGTL
ncbi:MAG: GTPase HflX [Eubacterium sp.]|nr:GTPase HflX [Eubacterium sp.]